MADKNKIMVSPGTYIPPELRGVIGVLERTGADPNASDIYLGESDNAIGFSIVDDDSSTVDEGDATLDAPTTLDIISQSVRTMPDGTQVVDIIINIGDVIGAQSYEIRLVKT